MKWVGIVLGVLLLVGLVLYATGYGQQLAFQAFVAANSPAKPFAPGTAVAAPDYAEQVNWAALPDIDDPADLVPQGVTEIAGLPAQGQRAVDVFFIHPTGFLKSMSWTSPMELDSATEENTQWMMANQASAFNGCCNVYAPRYREATIFAYFGDADLRDEVLGFAYTDVKRAFEYYLDHHNQGRPFVLASHSQGTHHALRLIQEVIDPSPVYEQMVAAYLIGAVLIPVSPSWFASLTKVQPCASANDLGCVVHWDTMPEGSTPMDRSEPSLCTNPLSWQVDETRVAASENTGAVVPEGTYQLAFGGDEDPASGQEFAQLAAPIPGQTSAQCKDGWLYAQDQTGSEFQAMGSGNLGSYHGLDYALYYMNVRNNAINRVQRFLNP